MSSSSKSSVVLERQNPAHVEVLPRVSHALEHVAGPWAVELAQVFPFPHTLLNRSSAWLHIAAMVLSNPIASTNNIRVIFDNVHDLRDGLHMAMPSFNRENASIGKKLSLPLWPKASYRQLSGLLEDKQATKLLRHADKVTPELVGLLHYLPSQLRIHQVIDHLLHDDEGKLIASMFGRLSNDHQQRVIDSLRNSSSRRDVWKLLRKAFMSSNGDFPIPPEINDPRIEPILSFDHLNQTAKAFQNCLGGFNHPDDAFAGSSAFYVFRGDEEAIIEVEARVCGLVISEIGGVSNKRLKDDTLVEIKKVFRENGISDKTMLDMHWSSILNCRMRELQDQDEPTSHRKHLVDELMTAVDQATA